jgi:hypothetical protein
LDTGHSLDSTEIEGKLSVLDEMRPWAHSRWDLGLILSGRLSQVECIPMGPPPGVEKQSSGQAGKATLDGEKSEDSELNGRSNTKLQSKLRNPGPGYPARCKNDRKIWPFPGSASSLANFFAPSRSGYADHPKDPERASRGQGSIRRVSKPQAMLSGGQTTGLQLIQVQHWRC